MAAGIVLAAALWCAVQGPAPGAPMELSFGRAAVKAGETATLPIYLVSDVNYQAPFQITLEFPHPLLTFEKIEPDYLAQRAKWTFQARVEPHPRDPARRILRIDVTPGASSFFPSGGIAHAHFLVGQDAPDGDIPIASALIAPIGAPPAVPEEAAKITVFTTPIFGCFFYMH